MFKNWDWENWIRGIIGGGISGGANAVLAGLTLPAIDSHDFYFGAGKWFTAVIVLFVMNAVVGALLYLKEHNIPEVKTVETTVERTTTIPPSTTIVETKKETHTEQVESKGERP